MKNILIIAVLLTCSFTSFAQKNIPNEVKTSFAKQYPLIKKVKWEKEKGNYEAGFTEDKIGKSVLFDSKGKILETETEIPVASLSKSITDYVSKNYPNQKIKGAAKITDSNKKITFEAEVKGQDLLFDEKGNFTKASKD